MKKIIITGVTGQDGSLMCDFLLENTSDYVIAGIRRLSVANHDNLEHLKGNSRFRLIDLDITDHQNTNEVVIREKPDFFINFAANSFVGNSWEMPISHMTTNCMAVLYQLEALRNFAPNCKYYNAGSSEEFGDVEFTPQNETHPLRPRSPYGASKASARQWVKVYRDSYNLYAVQGWLFNHEGDRRGEEFVTRKISKNIARISHAIKKGENFLPLTLGNLEAQRDWSDAADVIESVWLMLQQKEPKDYVISSGETNSVRRFLDESLKHANIKFKAEGEGINEKYYTLDGKLIFEVNPKYYRPAEVEKLQGDCSQAIKELKWERKTNFSGLVKKMFDHDYSLLM